MMKFCEFQNLYSLGTLHWGGTFSDILKSEGTQEESVYWTNANRRKQNIFNFHIQDFSLQSPSAPGQYVRRLQIDEDNKPIYTQRKIYKY